MKFTPVVIPKLAKFLFPNLIWEIPSNKKVIYLSFDDGPTPIITDWTLDVLKQFNAKATFFCIGKNIEAHPTIFKRIISEGHTIGNHSYSHLNGWKTSTKDYIEEVNKTELIIDSQFQNSEAKIQNFFRPPYGKIKPRQAKQLIQQGYKIIMWKVLAIDWDDSISNKRCLKNVVSNTDSGDIVVFHDSIKAACNMKYALPKVLQYFSERHFEFKRIPQ
jgi:peptidoglycan/xylan/chitin deacetylase (PgdA/CDA1 family)